jgi:hypothetical protein
MTFSYFGGGGGGSGGGGTNVMVPDYYHKEPYNHLPVYNSEWVVEKTGFIHVGIECLVTGGSNRCYICIDDERYLFSSVNSSQAVGDILADVIPVTKGNKVYIISTIHDGTKARPFCYFIPPKVNEIFPVNKVPEYISAMLTPDYSKTIIIGTMSSFTATDTGWIRWEYQDRVSTNSECIIYVDTGNGPNIVAQFSPQFTNASGSGYQNMSGIFPVRTGDIIRVQNTRVSGPDFKVTLSFIPPKASYVYAPVVSEEFGNYVCSPDLQNIDTSVNLITANGGEWAVNKTGFVQVGVTTTAEDNSSIIWTLNGRKVIERNSGRQSERSVDIFPVFDGDTVKLQALVGIGSVNDVSCYYVPPRFGAVMKPVKIETLKTYSTEEIDTGERWMDGTRIYRKIVYNNPLWTIPVGENSLVISNIFGSTIYVGRMINLAGRITRGNDGTMWAIPYANHNSTGIMCLVYKRSDDTLSIHSKWPTVQQVEITVWMEYTKPEMAP